MTLPDYSRGGFYNPQQTYNSYLQPQYPIHNISANQGQGGMNDILYRNYATETDPQAAYNIYLTGRGLGGTGSRARSAQQMFGQVMQGYEQAKLGSNYNLFFPEYLAQTNVEDIIKNQSFEQQGLDPGRFGQRKYRWGMRGG